MKKAICVAHLLLAVSAAFAVDLDESKVKREQVFEFAQKPEVARRGGKVTITFTSNGYCDATVAIEKADGKIVRHLASGVLGKNAPAPFQKNSLKQTLIWDGRDDAGKPVSPADCAVRVGLGLRAEFDRVLGWKGEAIAGGISGLTVDPRGNLYVLNSGFKRPTCVYVLTRRGEYVRTVVPWPADLPHEKVKALGFIEISEQERHPIIRNPIFFSFYPDWFGNHSGYNLPNQTMALVGDQLVMTNAWHCNYAAQVGERRLLIVNTDGSVPQNYLGPLLGRGRQPGFVRLAPVPGERAVFVTGLVDKADWKTAKPFHVVYKVGLDEKGPPEVYLGKLNKPGNDRNHFNDPRGLAVDTHGNLYVSDWGNNRIVVFKPDGDYLGEVAVEKPGQVALHQKTNAIYVMSVGQRRFPVGGIRIQKLAPAVAADGSWRGTGKPLAIVKLRYGQEIFTVDGTAEPTVLWIGSRFQTPALLRVIEEKNAFSRPAPTLPAGDPAFRTGGFVAVDRRTDEVYTRALLRPGQDAKGYHWIRIDGKTGKVTPTRIRAPELAVGPGGKLYMFQSPGGYRAVLGRFDRDGKPLPFAKTGSHVLLQGSFLKGTFFAWQHCTRGLSVAPNGDVYVLYPSHELKKPQKYLFCTVAIFGADGKLRRDCVIWASNAAAGVRADAAGNIYVADNVKPKGRTLPPEFEGRVPATRRWNRRFNWYPWLYGNVVKFPPAGGATKIPMAWAGYYRWKPLPEWRPPAGSQAPEPVECAWGHGRKAHVQNALRMFPGISPAPAPMGGCVCLAGRFDVDPYGRVFMPDVATFSVRVLDTNANPILRFGSYGNADSRGPKSAVPTPEIPFAWPQYVAVSDSAAYISDVINRRIVRVRLSCHASEAVALRAAPEENQ